VTERNHQVQQMRLIYREGEQGDVWLGLGSDASRRAFSLLHRMARDGVEKYGKFGNCSVADDWKAVVEICSIEYWKRAVRNFL
jgi:hypothetical protein